MNTKGISRPRLALIAGVVLVCSVAIALVEFTSREPQLVNSDRLVKALAQYATELHHRGVALPPSVSLDTLLQLGYLTPEDVKPLGRAKVTFYTDATNTNPQAVLVEAHMPDGTVQVVLADGSVQQLAPHKWEEYRQSLGQPGSANRHLEPGKTPSEPVASPTATLAVTNTGTGPLSYQWYVNPNAASATNASHLPLSYQWRRGTNASPATNR